MSSLNLIEPADIRRLKDFQLVKLLRILLYSEAKNIPASVHVPLQLSVPDGGEDGRWEGARGLNEYIPDALVIYQCKATKLSPGDCGAEILEDGHAATRRTRGKAQSPCSRPTVRKRVEEVLDRKGYYVFFCSHAYAQKDIDKRIASVREALRKAGRRRWKTDRISFLDGNKIANWTNGHTAAVAHVYECCNLPRPVAFLTWANWQRDPVVRAPRFHSNARLNEHMANLRKQLIQPRSVARITGLSGLGKTRLAFEALRPPQDPSNLEQALLSATTVYIDFEENPLAVFAMVRQWASAGLTGTIVVDNCPSNPPHHDKLADIVHIDGSNLSLLTLDYEPERVTAGFLHIGLEPEAMSAVVPAMLKDMPQCQSLTEHQINRIAEFASGFPQIAALMATNQDTLDLAHLNQKGLADRIIWGRDKPSNRAMQVIRSLALFTHVGFEGDVEIQKEFIRTQLCQGIPDHEFRELCSPFRRKRILQSVGDYVMVTPPPLAVALAADWWEHTTERQIIDLIPGMEECGLRPFFCKQVERLHFSQNAQRIASKLCAENGPLSSAEVLNSVTGSQLFRAIVELNPSAAVECAYRVFASMPREELLNIKEGRRDLVWSLEKLCWERENFTRAAELLLNFAAGENESWANNATGQFMQLFHLILSGTQAPAVERLTVIENGLKSDLPQKRQICIEALGSALKAQLFSRSGGVETRGSGLPQADWYPSGFAVIAEYWLRAVNLLKTAILEKTPEAPIAKRVLGENLRGILRYPLLDQLEPAIREIAEKENHSWLEAVTSLKMLLTYDEARGNQQALARIQKWIDLLTPTDLERRIELLVTHAPYEDRQDANGEYVDVAEKNARQLADEVSRQGDQWFTLLPKLLQGEQRQAWAFGQRLGELDTKPAVFAEKCIAELRKIDPKNRNVALLAGFLGGITDRAFVTHILDTVADEKDLITLLPQLTVQSKPQKGDIERVARLVLADKLDPRQLKIWRYGIRMRSLFSPDEVVSLLDSIVKRRPKARAFVYDVLCGYTVQSEQKWQACRDFTKRLFCSEGFLKSLDLHHDAYYWQQDALKILGGENDRDFSINQTEQILEIQTDDDHWLDADRESKKVLGELLKKHPDACWPLIGDVILSDRFHMLSSLFKEPQFEGEPLSVLWEVPVAVVSRWASEHPSAVWRLLETSALFTTAEDGTYMWHPTVLALLEQPFDEHWRSAIGSNLYSFGSIGSRVPYIERRISLLKKLEEHANSKIRCMASSLIAGFEKDKASQEKWDQERRAGIISLPPP